MGNEEAAAVTPRDPDHAGAGATRATDAEAEADAEAGAGAADSVGHTATGTEEPVPQRSRRFPVFTKDTARPEGGGRAAPGDAPAPARQWPMLVVAVGVLTGLLVTLGSFRAGSITVGLSLLAAGLMRWALPSVGMLAVRSRFTDVVTYAVLGLGITLLAMMAQPLPWVTIPFLDDIVHFTVR